MIIFSTAIVGALVIATGIGGGIYNYLYSSDKTITQNVLGNNQPETYIIKDGVRYYSRIDGKDISDLLKK
jgi:hypothetical protein